MASILLIDDDADLTDFLCGDLVRAGHAVECLGRAEHGPERLERGAFDVVLLDNMMPRMTGLEFLKALRDRGVAVPVILMTGESTPATAIEATKLGAFDYVIKPDTLQKLADELAPLIGRALEITRPVKEVRVSPGVPPSAEAGLVLVGGKNRRMVEEVYKRIAQFADGTDPVLILGETGCGKELVARAFHTNSPRKAKPFVALNCAAIPETLLESELFGHEANAFTGAKLRKGKVEYASGGTLFLDEIGDMPLNLQAKLLRVLEYQEVERLGGNEPIKVDVRLLSATHRDVEAAIREGKFRRDLFHRLNRVTLRLPPLRDRLDDLPDLADYFLGRAAEAAGRPRPKLAPAALARLQAHRWPGNVRELQNVMFRAFGVCRGGQILPNDLDLHTDEHDAPAPAGEVDGPAALQKLIAWAWDTNQEKLWPMLHDLLERELLKAALERLGGNQTQVSKRLGMARGTVIERVEKYGLK